MCQEHVIMYPINDYFTTSKQTTGPTGALGEGLSVEPKHEDPYARGHIGSPPDTNGYSPRIPDFAYLYLVYNIDIIEIRGNGVTSNVWVDDVCFMVKGDSEHENIKKLRSACQKADQWARTHASIFNPKKYALVQFVNTQEVDPQYTLLSPRAYSSCDPDCGSDLGYWLDPELEFHHHRERAIAKADVSPQALRSLAG
jgi:hypothetical protein